MLQHDTCLYSWSAASSTRRIIHILRWKSSSSCLLVSTFCSGGSICARGARHACKHHPSHTTTPVPCLEAVYQRQTLLVTYADARGARGTGSSPP